MRDQGWRSMSEHSKTAVSSQVMGGFPQLLGRRTGRTQHFWQLFHQRGRGKVVGELEVSSENEKAPSAWRESKRRAPRSFVLGLNILDIFINIPGTGNKSMSMNFADNVRSGRTVKQRQMGTSILGEWDQNRIKK